MRTTTTSAPSRESTDRPEWRRICHYYDHGSTRSVCGTATRRADRGHSEKYCNSRGHGVCVVCSELVKSENRTP
jgi:hypothetical protein